MNHSLIPVLLCASLCAQDPLKDIKHKDPVKRVAAIEAMRSSGAQDGVKLLIRALRDKDWEVRERAAVALGELKSAAAVKPLIDLCLKGPVARMRRAATLALAEIDTEAAIEALAKKTSGKTAASACRALAIILRGHDGALSIKRVKKLFGDKDPLVREAAGLLMWAGATDKKVQLRKMITANVGVAAAVLELITSSPRADDLETVVGAMTGPGMKDVLERRARHSVAAVLKLQKDPKGAAAELFAAMGDDDFMRYRIGKLVPVLVKAEVLDQAAGVVQLTPYLESADLHARSAAARSLREVGGEKALEACLRRFDAERSPRVRYQLMDSVVALRGLEKPEYVSWVADRLAKDKDALVRERAAVHLGKPELRGALSALVNAIEDPSWQVAVCAAVSLGKLRNIDGAEALVELASHSDWRRRGAAIVGLMHFNRRESVVPLIAAISDKVPAVARSAHEGLRRISSRRDIALDAAGWKAWWEAEGERYIFRDQDKIDENLRKYGYSVPDRKIYEGLDIIVLKSRGDHIEELLDRLEIKHRETEASKVEAAAVHPEAVCVINCTGEIAGGDIAPLAWFVRVGGSLFGSCWALHHTIEKITPGVIRKYEVRGHEVMDDVRAYPCDPNSPFLTGVFLNQVVPIYHLEGAHLIEVIDSERAEVLIDSPDAASRHGAGTLAAWFQAGHGVVLDSVNHFDLQGLKVAAGLKTPEQRQIYAIDHMGMTYVEWREIKKAKFWSTSPRASREVPDLSAFRFITNFVRAKRLK